MGKKVDVCYLDTFLSAPTCCRIRNMQLKWDDEKIQTVPVAICFMISGACMDILCIIKVKFLILIKWSHKSSKHVDYWS